MHNRPIVTCSPVDTTTSYSRGSGSLWTSFARAMSLLVSPLIAETTTTSWWPPALKAAILPATALIRSGVPTEVPPNFCTISAIPPSFKVLESYRKFVTTVRISRSHMETHFGHGTFAAVGMVNANISTMGPAGWGEDATTVARLERGEVDAADSGPPLFFLLMTGGSFVAQGIIT